MKIPRPNSRAGSTPASGTIKPITGNRITSIKPAKAGAEAGATRFIDASNLTILPGLWDSHIHPLTLYQGCQFGQTAALMLSYGLTSTLSVAGPLHQSIEMREALEAGNPIGPRVLQTVTINSAQMAYVDKDLDMVEPGKLADLVAVRGNPLADLKAAVNTPEGPT